MKLFPLPIFVFFIITISGPGNAQDTTFIPQKNLQGFEKESYRFEYDNDALFDKDSGFTVGWSLQKHTVISDNWSNLEGVPQFVGRWGVQIPTLSDKDSFKRAGIAIGQIIQTPTDLSRSDLIEEDVPYAGSLTVQATWYAFNNEQFHGFQSTLGMVGPMSLAEQTQKIFHKQLGHNDPKGWGNQLANELLLNFSYMTKKKLWQSGNLSGRSYDTSASGSIVLGNMFTHALTSVELRYGHNMPGGFVNTPDPIGYSMQYNAALAPANPNKAAIYGSFVVRGVIVAHNIFLDGNTFQDSHSVEKEPLVGQLIIGLHYERPDWSIHFNMFYSTDIVDSNEVSSAEGNEMFGNITFAWRI